MRHMTSNEIRETYLEYFREHGHSIMPSASLLILNDPTLLWNNAGVTPLKKYFDGSMIPVNKRMTSSQKCIRTNDIESVGDNTHHTFFEMLGNFSIGDYFKEEAIHMAFELLTDEKYFGFPLEKLYFTVYKDDDDAYNLWVKEGVDPTHIVRLESNFWEIGEGPCGPDSEIFYDRGESYDPDKLGIRLLQEEIDNSRYVEIWNNVFSQFNSKEGVDRKDYKELPSKNIDTGAGLERWCCIFQGVDSTFDTDVFVPIIKRIEQLTGEEYHGEAAFKIIADHVRAVTMALSDGAIFENNGRGYVLRRLLRRSVRMGKKLGCNEPFIYKLVDTVVDIMKDSYPDLINMKGNVKALILEEEKLFHNTLSAGEKRLEELIKESQDKTISGYDVFKLYDTYGFPYELTLEYLEEVGFTTSKDEFDKYMNLQKQMSKDSHHQESTMNRQNEELLNYKEESIFTYEKEELSTKIIGLFKDGEFVDYLDKDGYVILKETCFYATSGGQECDRGAMKSKNFKAKVIGVEKAPNGQHLHRVEVVDGTITLGDLIDIKIIG